MKAMQPSPRLFPDAAAEVIGYLTSRFSIISNPPRVAMDMRGWDRSTAIAQVTRTGGTSEGILDYPLLQIDVYAPTWDEALDVVNLIRAFLAEAPLEMSGVVAADETIGPYVVDATDQLPRINGQWSLAFRGADPP